MSEASVCGQWEPSHTLAETSNRRNSVAVRLLGSFDLSIDEEPVDLPEASRRLIAYLALVGRPTERAVVAGALWPDCCEARAIANLRAARWRLPATGGPPMIHFQRSRIGLQEWVSVDATALEAQGWALLADPICDGADLHRDLLFAPLLAGWYEDWVVFERERRQQLHLRFAEALVDWLVRHDRLAEALDVALRLVECDPLRSGGQRSLISVYSAEGNFSQARAQFERHRRELADELGCVPGFELVEVVKTTTAVMDG